MEQPRRPGPALLAPDLVRAAPLPAAGNAARAGDVPAITTVVRGHLAQVLGLADQEVDADQAFADLGLDSIFRMELVRLLGSRYAVTIKAAELYEYDTPRRLADRVASLLASGSPAAEPPAEPPLADRVEQVEPPLADRVEPVEPPLADRVEVVLAGLLRTAMGRVPADGASFAEDGWTSFDMLRIVSILEGRLGRLRKTLLFDHGTVAALAAHLAERFGPDVTGLLAPGTPPGPGGPVTTPDATATDAATLDAAALDAAALDARAAGPLVVPRRSLAQRPDIERAVADITGRHGMELGLAGRDIAPLLFLGSARRGYFTISTVGADLFAWIYVGSEQHLPELAGELIRYAREHGQRANFLSLIGLKEADGIPCTATPIGALQRLEDIGRFSLDGAGMRRLRYMVRRLEREGDGRTTEYRPGSDPATDRQIVALVDAWAGDKPMVNSYVQVVREELAAGRLDGKHRIFLTFAADRMINAVIVTRMAATSGYLLDQEFYPADMPLGGLEFAITQIIGKLAAEGCSTLSFGASLGVEVCESPNAAPEVAEGLRELRSVGIFGEGNFRFKNKFRPANLPIYLCQPADEERTDVSRVILMIANAEPRDAAAPEPHAVTVPSPDPAPAGHLDLSTDSWGEREHPFISGRMRALRERSAAADGAPGPAPSWLPFGCLVPTVSAQAAIELLCACWPGPRGTVLYDSLPARWLLTLADSQFTPVRLAGRPGAADLDALDEALGRAAAQGPRPSFCCLDLGATPVTLAMLRAVKDRLSAAGLPLVLDASHAVTSAMVQTGTENAGPDGAGVWDLTRDMLELADAVTLGLTEDFGLDTGGLVAAGDGDLAELLRERVALRGHEVNLAGRKLVATALRDTDTVLAQVRRRVGDVAAARVRLAEHGVPVRPDGPGHVLAVDTRRLNQAGRDAPEVADTLARLREHAGIAGRAGPEGRAGDAEFALPVGLTPDDMHVIVAGLAALAAGAATSAPAGPALPGAPPPPNARVLRDLGAEVRRVLVEVPGGTVETFTAGTGPAVLLIHPFNIGAGLFAPQIAALADRYTFIVAHAPGVGDTRHGGELALADLARIQREVLGALAVPGPVHVAGASFGGLVAQEFALRYPRDAASVTILCGSYRIANRPGRDLANLAEVARTDFDRLEDRAGPLADRERLESLLLRCESMDPATGLRYLDTHRDAQDLLPRVPQITTPTLVVQGRHDSVIPVKTGHLLHGLIPDSRYAELEAGHFPTLTCPDEVNRILDGFWSDHAPHPAAAAGLLPARAGAA